MAATRPDLAAMLSVLDRLCTAAELPVLEDHGLTMWGYVVLLRLGSEPVRTQAALAEAVGADKTRIIEFLDDLQEQGLITRTPDPADRRARLVALTPAGRRRLDATQRAIQRNEHTLLSVLGTGERAAFLRTLETLARAAPDVLG